MKFHIKLQECIQAHPDAGAPYATTTTQKKKIKKIKWIFSLLITSIYGA
jgi:hypothetical protein